MSEHISFSEQNTSSPLEIKEGEKVNWKQLLTSYNIHAFYSSY